MKATHTVPTVSFWVISIALLLWGLGGASIYIAYFIETPEEFAQTAETAANRQAYADYIAHIPFWAIAVGMIAAVTRLLGAIGLLRRRALALPFYIISVVFCPGRIVPSFCSRQRIERYERTPYFH